jgi:extracellular elastinolytic metalloproteinase
VTNLFYWNNVNHDVFLHYGFDEAAGNFQLRNYTGAGFGDDEVQADALDGSGTNNANFGTPPEPRGAFAKPRMQMYVWTPPDHRLDVHSPASIAGSYIAGSAAFGPRLNDTGLRADLKLANDGAGATTDGCEAFPAGFFLGTIAVMDRGTCSFVIKVKNAQNAGAVGAIVVNNADTGPIVLGGADATITIPAISLSRADGDKIKPELAQTVANGTIRKPADLGIPNRDSDFDAGVITHEYGHGISVRLTGGPQNHLCLVSNLNTPAGPVAIPSEQMGEGWSDFFGLVLTAKPEHTATRPRGIGSYLSFQPAGGPGIRNFPYTTDMRKNPQTYDTIKTAAVPHGVGAVWATMLWDMYWNLVTVHGFDPDIYRGDGGNNLALRLVMDGLKLQPCMPSFVDGRNAILLADQINNGGANQCHIWRAFARRGLGAAAVAGSSVNNTDGAQDFTLPPQCGNSAPAANDDQTTVNEDSGSNSIDVLANDTTAGDVGEQLTITAATQGAHGTVAITDGGARVTYTPSANFSGTDSFTYTVKDSFNATDTATVQVTVSDSDCVVLDDSHPTVSYRSGWGLVEDAAAIAGAYHRRAGNPQGGAAPEARFVFDGPSLTYYYAVSPQGGLADVYLDGQFLETINYASPALTFGRSRTYAVAPGRHEFQLRYRSGVVYVDGFGLDCAAPGANVGAVQ